MSHVATVAGWGLSGDARDAGRRERTNLGWEEALTPSVRAPGPHLRAVNQGRATEPFDSPRRGVCQRVGAGLPLQSHLLINVPSDSLEIRLRIYGFRRWTIP